MEVFKACSKTFTVKPLQVIKSFTEHYVVESSDGQRTEPRVTQNGVIFKHEYDAFEYLMELLHQDIKVKQAEIITLNQKLEGLMSLRRDILPPIA